MPQPFLTIPQLEAGDCVVLIELDPLIPTHDRVAAGGGIKAGRFVVSGLSITVKPCVVAAQVATHLTFHEFDGSATKVRRKLVETTNKVGVPRAGIFGGCVNQSFERCSKADGFIPAWPIAEHNE